MSDNFAIKGKVSIEQSDSDTLMEIKSFEKKAEEVKIISSWGWEKFIKSDDIFNIKNKYLNNDCLTFVIDVSV